MNDTITVPRELFERLVEYSLDLKSGWEWKSTETRPRIVAEWNELCRDVQLAVELRDRTDLPSGD